MVLTFNGTQQIFSEMLLAYLVVSDSDDHNHLHFDK